MVMHEFLTCSAFASPGFHVSHFLANGSPLALFVDDKAPTSFRGNQTGF